MKMHYQQPTRTLPHLRTVAEVDRLSIATARALNDLVANRAAAAPSTYLRFYREYDRLLKDCRTRTAQLIP